MFTITISGREFTAEGPTPKYGTYLLTGPRGAVYLATPAYVGDAHTYKVIGGRYCQTELRINGNAVRLSDASGELVQVAR
jgi:hypothetical protein